MYHFSFLFNILFVSLWSLYRFPLSSLINLFLPSNLSSIVYLFFMCLLSFCLVSTALFSHYHPFCSCPLSSSITFSFQPFLFFHSALSSISFRLLFIFHFPSLFTFFSPILLLLFQFSVLLAIQFINIVFFAMFFWTLGWFVCAFEVFEKSKRLCIAIKFGADV